ncbi:hypothetical protein PI23P_08535 [Polaribacter irgensii 23-P]|uniref:Uncharacterized protein n=1 Tax=Polaribacter irgensii 23-P TaxID=313594 RepID=A4BZR6_9FLAO|nr:hypothetical protein PI23P_08535 [Polaribacter irgensii 23-P]
MKPVIISLFFDVLQLKSKIESAINKNVFFMWSF